MRVIKGVSICIFIILLVLISACASHNKMEDNLHSDYYAQNDSRTAENYHDGVNEQSMDYDIKDEFGDSDEYDASAIIGTGETSTSSIKFQV